MATRRKDGRYTASKTDPATGKRVWGYGRTADEADADLAAKLAPYRHPLTASPTLHEVAEALWLPKVLSMADRTLARYLAAYAYIPRSVRDLLITEITRHDVNALVVELGKRKVSRSGHGKATHPMSAASIGMVISVLRQILVCAMDSDIITRLATDRVKLPRKPAKRERVIEPSEAEDLIRSMAQTPIALPVLLSTVLGLRRSEICGLRWEDLSRQRGEITVRRQIRAAKGNGLVETNLKTDAGRRTLHLPKQLIERVDQLGNPDSLYICGTAWATPMRPNQITRWWTDLRPEAFATWTFHDLRHGSAGLLYALTGNLEVVRTILGHSTTDMSLVYIGANKSGRKQAIDSLASVLGIVDEHLP